MRPIIFNECFGWLHEAEGKTGVVLCNPYGHEALWTHRGWRTLATHLADHRFPTLRFDYRGTGDSAGAEGEGDAIETWLSSIEDAVRYMREHAGVSRVVLCGIRLGATLAALVSRRVAVDGLIMMAAVTSGPEYLRELRLIQRRWRNTAAAHIAVDAQKPEYLETLGFRLYPPTLAHLENIVLPRELQPSVPHVLLLDPEKSREASKVLAFYREQRVDVEMAPFDDYAALLSEESHTSAPQVTMQRLTDWLRVHVDAAAMPVTTSAPTRGAAPPHEESVRVTATLRGDGFRETPVTFDNGRLFGVYCRPALADPAADADDEILAGAARGDQPPVATGQYAVLFANTAASHHIGEARMWVTQARLLAQRGIASLRMDVGVLGDSAGAQQSITSAMLHDMRSCADVSEGVNWLVDAGHTRPTTVGICSGAYLSFHAAVMNPRVVGTVLVNQGLYVWSEKRAVVDGPVVAPTSVYLASVRRADKWKRLLTGQIAVGQIASTLARRRMEQWRRQGLHLLSALRGQESRTGIVRKAFDTLARRGVNVRIFYGEFDIGLEESATFFGRDFKWLRGKPGVRISTERTLDHALFLYPARALMLEVIESHLQEQASGLLNVQPGGSGAPRFRWRALSRRRTPLQSVPVKR